MTERGSGRTRGGRRKQRVPAERSKRSTEVYRQLVNPHEPPKVLSEDEVAHIHLRAVEFLRDHGMRVLLPEASELLASAGARVVDGMVRLDPEMVEAAVASAPREFSLAARNPRYDAHLGGQNVNFLPAGGPPFASDLERGRRTGSFADFTDFIKMSQSFDVMHMLAPSVEATDIAVNIRHLHTMRATLTLSDKVPYMFARGRSQMADYLDMLEIAFGVGREELARRPVTWTNINTNSPLQLDVPMAMAIIDCAKAGQPVIMTPFTLAGAMAPVTLAGALVLQHIEALLAITLSQTAMPGAPVVYGAFTSNVDMKSGSPAFGTPEAMRGAYASGQLARHLGLPWRSSGSSASNTPDAQGGYETMINMYGALMGGADIILHAAGWQEGGLTASYEKFILDIEMLQILAEGLQPVIVNDDELAIDAILDVGPGGHFFGTQHTLDRFETAFYDPLVFSRTNFEQWEQEGSKDAQRRALGVWKKVLADFEPPPIDDAIVAELDDYVARRTAEGGSPPD
jgi:trimethylamine--corrinoid protein Co-methyltransferase